MLARFAKGILLFSSVGALWLWSSPGEARFGGHFGGGYRGGGFGHFGGGHFGGMRFGGRHFGGMRFGGHHFAAGHFAHRSFAHRAAGHFQHRAVTGHHFAGRGLGRAGLSRSPATQRFAGRSNSLARAAVAGAGLHHVHGFSNFGQHAFNRNGFGNQVAWNRWNWRWGHNCCGWFGPVFWPFFIGDVFTAVLWPWDYYDPFWAYGSDYILGSIFWAGASAPLGYATTDAYDVYRNRSASSDFPDNRGNGAGRRESAEQAAFSETCIGLAPGVTALPMGTIESEVRPSGDQVTAFEELKSALSKADDMVRASCSNEVALTPVKRLDVVQMRLTAMTDVVRTIRPPLGDFYSSLTDAQRQRLDALRGQVVTHGRHATTSPGSTLASLCSERAEAFSQLPVQRIEEFIRPTAEQRDAFDALKTASAKAADQLRSSCPVQLPTGLADRLQAVDTRLAAMLAAVDDVRPALQNFYALLTDEQKARFNSWGQPQTQARTNSG